VVQGVLTDREDGSPVGGALVLLVDPVGTELMGRLSNDEGGFRLVAPAPGSYRLRVVRIGYANLLSDPFRVSEVGPTQVNLQIQQEPIPIRGIDVEGVQGCEIRPAEGLAVARVWEAVQKALTVQTWTEREAFFRFEVLVYERELSSEGEEGKTVDLAKTEILGRIPMQSLPADTLVAEGFVREIEDGVFEYLAPDAHVLLSNAFLNTHCMKLTDHPATPRLIGLGFEPARDGDLPDVEGTLWVDRESGELRSLEYRYTWVPYDKGREQAGGRVEFEALPDGEWIVRQWWIRMPTVRLTTPPRAPETPFRETGVPITVRLNRPPQPQLAGFREAGAMITKVTRIIH
jgi:hypothetical protein